MDLKECEEKGFIKKTFPNTEKAQSLMNISDIKEEEVLKIHLDERSINAYLPMAYDALRKTMEALCLIKGYKVANHICIGELLKKIYGNFDLMTFDRLRYARNSINYYGEKIDLEQGMILIKKIFDMKKEVRKLLI